MKIFAGEKMTKKKLFYIIILFITVVCLLSSIFIPETGQLVLLKEFFTVLLMIILAVAMGKSLPSVFKSKKHLKSILVIFVFVILCFVAVFKTADIFKDIIAGTETITLYNCSIDRSPSIKFIWRQHYYLRGLDSNGTAYRFRISGNDYNNLKETDEVTVSCYKNTQRIVEFKN